MKKEKIKVLGIPGSVGPTGTPGLPGLPPKKNLYNLAKYAIENHTGLDGKVNLQKAATDYEIGGTLTPTDGLNLFDTIIKENDFLSRVRFVPCESIKKNLNSFVNEGVLRDRDNVSDRSGMRKDNIGNDANLKEIYYIFDQEPEELVNFARIGPQAFESGVTNQIAIGYANRLEEEAINGDDGVNRLHGLLKKAKDNLATTPAEEATGKKVRNINTNGVTTITARLKAVLQKQQSKYRKPTISTFVLSLNDYEDYVDEVIATTGLTGGRDILTDQKYKYKGYELLVNTEMPDNNILFGPLNNICYCVNIAGIKRSLNIEDRPSLLEHTYLAFIDYQFATFDKVVIGYDQG